MSTYAHILESFLSLPVDMREKIFLDLAKLIYARPSPMGETNEENPDLPKRFVQDVLEARDDEKILTHEEVFGDLYQKRFSVKEVAEIFGKSELTIRRWVKDGKIKAIKAGGAYQFSLKDIEDFKNR